MLLVGWAALAASLRTMRARAHGLAVTALTALATGVLGLVAVSLPFNTSTMRYAVDFTPMLLVAACIGVVTLVGAVPSLIYAAGCIGGFLVAAGIATVTALTVMGTATDTFRSQNDGNDNFPSGRWPQSGVPVAP